MNGLNCWYGYTRTVRVYTDYIKIRREETDMNQQKIGAFIAGRRKEFHLTQKELAEKLGITDRAVSKWETGRSMPDVSLLQPLSRILGVGVNDLLSGEILSDSEYREKSETNIISIADLNTLKSFQYGFYGSYPLAVVLLSYSIMKGMETAGILSLICSHVASSYYFRYRTMRNRTSMVIALCGLVGTVTSLIGFLVRTW